LIAGGATGDERGRSVVGQFGFAQAGIGNTIREIMEA
jgi:hypothetical protein